MMVLSSLAWLSLGILSNRLCRSDRLWNGWVLLVVVQTCLHCLYIPCGNSVKLISVSCLTCNIQTHAIHHVFEMPYIRWLSQEDTYIVTWQKKTCSYWSQCIMGAGKYVRVLYPLLQPRPLVKPLSCPDFRTHRWRREWKLVQLCSWHYQVTRHRPKYIE